MKKPNAHLSQGFDREQAGTHIPTLATSTQSPLGVFRIRPFRPGFLTFTQFSLVILRFAHHNSMIIVLAFRSGYFITVGTGQSPDAVSKPLPSFRRHILQYDAESYEHDQDLCGIDV